MLVASLKWFTYQNILMAKPTFLVKVVYVVFSVLKILFQTLYAGDTLVPKHRWTFLPVKKK